MLYFKRDVIYPSKRTNETNKNLDKLFKEYEAHLRSIKEFLPEDARRLSNISFHDAHIKAVTQVSKKSVEVILEGGGFDLLQKDHLEYGEYTLSFSGVKKVWIPYTVIGDIWLYEEMHLSDVAAFDYQALLYKDEIRIQADDVLIKIEKKLWGKT